MKKRMLVFVVATVSLLLLFNRCMFDDADSLYDGPAFISSLKVYGMVNDIDGNPIKDVRIKTENATGQVVYTNTDAQGFFIFDQVRARNNRIVLEADKEGYFHKSFATSSLKNDAKVRFVMNEKTMTTLSASTGNSVVVSENATVHFEANSLVTESGTPYQGEVQVAYTYADPQSPVFSLIMQGGDLRGINSNQQEQYLISYGALAVELSSSSGEPLNLAPGQTATIEMTVSDEQLGNTPATIPLWYFDDEKNVWIEDGYSTLQGNKYIGQVSHFTWWNLDIPTAPNTFVTGKVFDCSNNPLVGVAVRVGPVTAFTDADGIYKSNVASGLTFSVSVNSTLNGGLTSQLIMAPAVPAGTTVTLEKLVIICPATISGNINKCEGSSVFVYTDPIGGAWYDIKPVSDPINLPVSTGISYNMEFRVSTSHYNVAYDFVIPPLNPGQNYNLPSVIEAGCPVNISGKLVDCMDNPVGGHVKALFSGNQSDITVGSDGLYDFFVPEGSFVDITATRTFPNSFTETVTASVQTSSSTNSYIIPAFHVSCSSTVNGSVITCSGSPIESMVKFSWAGQNKNVLASGGYFSIEVPGGKVIDISVQEFIVTGFFSDQTSVNTIDNQAVDVSLQLCEQVDCPVTGVQYTANGNTIDYPGLSNFNTATSLNLPLTTAIPGQHAMTPFDVPFGYTLVYVTDGPLSFSLMLPQPIQTGTYDIASYPNVAFDHPIGVMLVNNTSPTFILTQGQIYVTESSGASLSGNFIGSVGSIIGVSQVATPAVLVLTGNFCISN